MTALRFALFLGVGLTLIGAHQQLATAAEPPIGFFKNIVSKDVEYAWQSLEGDYLPPSADKFFPKDEAAGEQLDRLFLRGTPEFRPDDEILKLVRIGMRHTRAHRTSIVRWVGNSYIWGKDEQSPDAIELMYHAADFSGPNADALGTRHYAVYFGLSVVDRKTPAIVRTLVELCLRVDDPNDLSRVAWGAATQRDELLAALQPHLVSADSAFHDKARTLEQIFKGELKAFAWAAERARKRALEKYADQLPQFKAQLGDGDTEARRSLLQKILQDRISLIMDDTFLPAFAKCAKDPDPQVRNQVAIIAGDRWVWSAQEQHPDAIKLMLDLSRDDDRQVRYNAVYYGLSTVRKKDDDVIKRLLDMAIDDRQSDLPGRIIWGLKTDKERTKELLKAMLQGTDMARAKQVRERYQELTGEELPTESK